MLLTKEVEVKIRPQTLDYYKSLGYEIPMKKATESTYKKYKKEFVYDFDKLIVVKIEDLPKQSNIKVEVLCDYCKKEVFSVAYSHYNNEMEYVAKHACKNCRQKKLEDVVMIKYGVSHTSKLKSTQEKREETLKRNYGVSVPLKSKEIKEKQVQTVHNVYGVENISQIREVKEKKKQTTFEHFGVNVPSQSEEVKNKMRETFEQKYGYDNPAKSLEVREKMAQTLYVNSSQRISKQQLYIFNLCQSVNLNTKLNYPISKFNTDICFLEEKLIIEYDGGFHDGQIKLGAMTQEEFDQKELIRDKVIKSDGYKMIRIKSQTDKLPQDSVLLQMLQDARQYFITTSHTWQTYDIDKSMLFNAENKNGTPYDFGELRTIKDSDIAEDNNIDSQMQSQTQII